jgi:hypothetical protein
LGLSHFTWSRFVDFDLPIHFGEGNCRKTSDWTCTNNNQFAAVIEGRNITAHGPSTVWLCDKLEGLE